MIASQFLLVALAVTIVYAVICRARHFDRTTVWYVKAQHAALAVGAMLSVVVPIEWGAACIAAGAALFLIIASPRWRHSPPKGITKGA